MRETSKPAGAETARKRARETADAAHAKTACAGFSLIRPVTDTNAKFVVKRREGQSIEGSQLSIPTIKYPHKGENTPALRCVWINTSPPHRERGVLRVRGNLTGGLLVPLGIWGHRGPDPRPLSSLPLRQRDISASPSAFGKGIITRAAYP